MPVEYELVRSIATVAGDQRKKLGVVKTDAEMMGGFSMAGMQPRQIPKQLILEELEKQYKVEEVDPTNSIEPGRYDALLIVQPSTLGPPQLANVVEAVKKGQPSVIFEDPFPLVMPQAVGTTQEKPPQGGMFGMGGGPQPKGDIGALWDALEIQVTGDTRSSKMPGQRAMKSDVIWQVYNPYPRFQGRGLGPELVFIRNDMPDNREPFNHEAPVVSGFEEVLFPYPTGISQQMGAKLKMTELVRSADGRSGTIDTNKLQATQLDPISLELERGRPSKQGYILAAWIRGDAKAEGAESADKSVEIKPTSTNAESTEAGRDGKPAGVNAIYVADIDVLSSVFVRMRNEPNLMVARFRFDNVPFVCNLIDAVAGESRFLEIRKRKPKHSTLRMVELRAADARDKQKEANDKKQAEYEKELKKADEDKEKTFAEFKKIFEDLQKKQQAGDEVDPAKIQAAATQLAIKQRIAERTAEVTKERLKRERDQELAEIERQRDQDLQQIQNDYKIQATVFPPILPLLVGLVVWARRRIREREGVSRSRMRS
jgi:ABC-2 type transport system permease protein